MANTYRIMDQKLHLDNVNHDARIFVNDEDLASNCEGFGEGHFNLIASQICRENNNTFKKAKDQIIQHFFNDMDEALSNFKRRVLPLDSAKGCAPVDRIDKIISIATKLLTDIIIRIVQAPQSDWPTQDPEMKGRQHSNKSTCPWLVMYRRDNYPIQVRIVQGSIIGGSVLITEHRSMYGSSRLRVLIDYRILAAAFLIRKASIIRQSRIT